MDWISVMVSPLWSTIAHNFIDKFRIFGAKYQLPPNKIWKNKSLVFSHVLAVSGLTKKKKKTSALLTEASHNKISNSPFTFSNQAIFKSY